jgi:hypothetical protein
MLGKQGRLRRFGVDHLKVEVALNKVLKLCFVFCCEVLEGVDTLSCSTCLHVDRICPAQVVHAQFHQSAVGSVGVKDFDRCGDTASHTVESNDTNEFLSINLLLGQISVGGPGWPAGGPGRPGRLCPSVFVNLEVAADSRLNDNVSEVQMLNHVVLGVQCIPGVHIGCHIGLWADGKVRCSCFCLQGKELLMVTHTPSIDWHSSTREQTKYLVRLPVVPDCFLDVGQQFP